MEERSKKEPVEKEAAMADDSSAGAGTNRREAGDAPSQGSGPRDQGPPLPEINFASFIITLSSSALIHFGEIPEPTSNQKQCNLPLAKQTIDILGLLKEKTVGNLSQDEGRLLDSLLYDLRMRYVEAMKKDCR